MSSLLTKTSPRQGRESARSWRVIICLAGLALGGCSPAFNWRELRVEEASLSLMLPCKPDRGQRSVSLAGQSVEMSMVGCETGDALLALSHMPLPTGLPVGEALAQWRAVTLQHLGAASGGDVTQAFVPPGALVVPQSVRQRVQGRRSDGSPVQAQLAWFAQVGPQGTRLFQAAFYAPKVPAEPAQTWLDSLRFQ